MQRELLFTPMIAALILFACAGEVCAQEETPRFEIGVQFTSLTIREPIGVASGGFSHTEPGVGGRFTFNITEDIAAEAEVNLFPRDPGFRNEFTGGRRMQTSFGIKAGKRFERFGIYGKARPGFVRSPRAFAGFGYDPNNLFDPPRFESRTEFAINLGGVVEFYPSRRIVTRFDIGDTIIRYRDRTITTVASSPPLLPLTFRSFVLPGDVKHNFQFNAGVGFRFQGIGN